MLVLEGFGADGDSNVDVYTGQVKSLFWEFWPNFGLQRPKFSYGPPSPLFCWGQLYHRIATFIIIIYDNCVYLW